MTVHNLQIDTQSLWTTRIFFLIDILKSNSVSFPKKKILVIRNKPMFAKIKVWILR